MASKVGTKELTALDLIKGLSMFVMMTDHVGYYFFPRDLWFRSFGRIDFPVWFFLPGYSKSRAFEISWLVCGIVLVAANIFTGFSLLPVNAIFTIMLIRFSTDRLVGYMTGKDVRKFTGVMLLAVFAAVLVPLNVIVFGPSAAAHRPPGSPSFFSAALLLDAIACLAFASYVIPRYRFWLTAFLLAALFPFTRLFFEYGSLALIIGVFGWLCRNRGELPDGDRLARHYGIFSWLAFSGLQQHMFGFDMPQFLLMSLGTGMYFVILYLYRPRIFPQAASKTAALPVAIVQFLGRYTLEIYVFHLLLFKAIHLWLRPELFMKWHLFVGEAMHAQI
jgi:hypothetical protein